MVGRRSKWLSSCYSVRQLKITLAFLFPIAYNNNSCEKLTLIMQTIIQRLQNGWTALYGEGDETIPIHHPASNFDKRVLRLIEQLLAERDGAIRVIGTREQQLNQLSHAYETLEGKYNELLERHNSDGRIPETNAEADNSGRGTVDSTGEAESPEKSAG